MNAYTNGPIHERTQFRRPTYTNASMSDPRPLRLRLLRSSCGHVLGIALVGRRQRVIQWATCR